MSPRHQSARGLTCEHCHAPIGFLRSVHFIPHVGFVHCQCQREWKAGTR